MLVHTNSERNISGLKILIHFPLHFHLSLNLKGCWGTTDDFTTSFLHFSLFSTALWDLANSRPVHSLMSSNLFFCLPCHLFPFTVLCKMVLAGPDEQETRPFHCSLHLLMMVRSSCGLIGSTSFPWLGYLYLYSKE